MSGTADNIFFPEYEGCEKIVPSFTLSGKKVSDTLSGKFGFPEIRLRLIGLSGKLGYPENLVFQSSRNSFRLILFRKIGFSGIQGLRSFSRMSATCKFSRITPNP